jgi:hypothetical protein
MLSWARVPVCLCASCARMPVCRLWVQPCDDLYVRLCGCIASVRACLFVSLLPRWQVRNELDKPVVDAAARGASAAPPATLPPAAPEAGAGVSGVLGASSAAATSAAVNAASKTAAAAVQGSISAAASSDSPHSKPGKDLE